MNYKGKLRGDSHSLTAAAQFVQAGRERGAGTGSLGAWCIRTLTPCQSIHPAWAAPLRLPSLLFPATRSKGEPDLSSDELLGIFSRVCEWKITMLAVL